jgi:glutamate formiminotransferase
MPIMECVANFSEGRRPAVIVALRAAIEAVPDVRVLDIHSDSDHNRTVITFAGAPEPVTEAAYQAIARAAELIDMRQQQGQHPRIGAADVVPLVPITDITLEECADLAHELGERVGRELGIPVFLYEAAATRPERVNLADVRRGQYEELAERLPLDPPDFGPTTVGPAGATAIGARWPLLAYNVYLNTTDVEIARDIARRVRQSSGGLPYVKALGLLVGGRAQVSMNLTDLTQTSLPVVMERLRQEAAQQGVAIESSELVGLIPQAAVDDVVRYYLQLPDFDVHRILEQRWRQAADTTRPI